MEKNRGRRESRAIKHREKRLETRYKGRPKRRNLLRLELALQEKWETGGDLLYVGGEPEGRTKKSFNSQNGGGGGEQWWQMGNN